MSMILLLSALFSTIVPQTTTGDPAAIPPQPQVYRQIPWEDPLITGINRERSRSTSYSFSDIPSAINGNRERSRFLLLNGRWDFHFAPR
ncbi:MAG: hypothetical protein KA247_06700, partial [Bacteroidetes bacterium]|nr:hypothetical protein [Bacteroidota bacterium]